MKLYTWDKAGVRCGVSGTVQARRVLQGSGSSEKGSSLGSLLLAAIHPSPRLSAVGPPPALPPPLSSLTQRRAGPAARLRAARPPHVHAPVDGGAAAGGRALWHGPRRQPGMNRAGGDGQGWQAAMLVRGSVYGCGMRSEGEGAPFGVMQGGGGERRGARGAMSAQGQEAVGQCE